MSEQKEMRERMVDSKARQGRRGIIDRIARKAVQFGFLLLFLYPFLPMIYSQATQKSVPELSSWLLPFDPLLFLGHVVHRDWAVVVLGAPLLLLALTFFLGRFFCGWVCPVGTVLDVVRAAADGVRTFFDTLAHAIRRRGRRKRRPIKPASLPFFPASSNSPARYVLLAVAVAGGLLSLQALGALDPLVIFHRAATVVASDVFALQRPILRLYLTASAVFLAIVVLELWQPRFWCRHLCPLGALLNLTSRWTLLNRKVSGECNLCGDCRRACPMQAIPKEGHDTHYGDCHVCLACEGVCPRGAISFGFGPLAGRRWLQDGRTTGADGKPRLKGRYVAERGAHGLVLSRRTFMAGLAAGATGVALPAAIHAAPKTPAIRPPGALPESDFLRTCVLCQECARICPTTGLRPVAWELGAAGIGTPRLVPRQGGCLRYTSCPNLCAQVCPAGAIKAIPKEQMKLGRAQVERSACLAWDQGAKCLVCVEACPTGAAQPFDGRVTVDPQKCIGCGLCEHACPVADGAIHVYPLTV